MTYLIKKESLRPSFGFLLILFMLFMTICICFVHSIYAVKQGMQRRPIKMAAIAVIGSSDLALNTAARYIRHVSLTDVSTAFQDCPSCLDYFPGALGVNPPNYLGINTSFE